MGQTTRLTTGTTTSDKKTAFDFGDGLLRWWRVNKKAPLAKRDFRRVLECNANYKRRAVSAVEPFNYKIGYDIAGDCRQKVFLAKRYIMVYIIFGEEYLLSLGGSNTSAGYRGKRQLQTKRPPSISGTVFCVANV